MSLLTFISFFFLLHIPPQLSFCWLKINSFFHFKRGGRARSANSRTQRKHHFHVFSTFFFFPLSLSPHIRTHIKFYLIFSPLNFLWHHLLPFLIQKRLRKNNEFKWRERGFARMTLRWRQKILLYSVLVYRVCVCMRRCGATIKPLDKFRVVIL